MRTMRFKDRPAGFYVGVSAALLVIVLALVLASMDWNLFKGPIARYASARSGRMVTIAGPLQVKLWSLTPTITVNGLTIGNPPWEPSRPLARIERLQVQIEATSLLHGHLILRHVEVIRPELYLHQERSGRANWTFENNAPSKTRAAGPTQLPVLKDLVIESGKLTLVDELRRLKLTGTIEARERGSGNAQKPFHIDAKGTINEKPFKLDLAGGPLQVLSPNRPYPFSLAITAGENEIQAQGVVPKPFDLGELDLQVDAQGQDLAELYYLTQITLPNSPPFRLRAHLARHGQRFTVRDISGALGQSDLAGSVDIDASTKRPLVQAKLISNHLFMKDFAALTGTNARASDSFDAKPASSTAAPSSPPPAARQLFPDARLQVDRLRAIDADVSFRATSIEAGAVPFTGVTLRVRLDDAALTIEPLRFEMPQGRFSGNVRINGRVRPPQVAIDLRAEDIRLAQLKGTGSAAPPLDGTLEARAIIEGTGDSIHGVMSDANGRLTAIVPDGDIRAAFAELTGIDVAEGIGLLLKSSDERAAIRCGVAQFDIKGGTAHVQHLVLDTQNIVITAGGQVYLGPERLDLTLEGKPKKFRLVRLRSPVQIKGTLTSPSFRLEAGHTIKQAAIATALGTLLTPLAAILAFVDPGLAKNQNCAQLLAQAQPQTPSLPRETRPAPHSPKPTF
jgi:AsmA family protein